MARCLCIRITFGVQTVQRMRDQVKMWYLDLALDAAHPKLGGVVRAVDQLHNHTPVNSHTQTAVQRMQSQQPGTPPSPVGSAMLHSVGIPHPRQARHAAHRR